MTRRPTHSAQVRAARHVRVEADIYFCNRSRQQTAEGMAGDAPLYGGVFREEIAQQLLCACTSIVRACFSGLYEQCEQKQDGAEVFRACIDTVRNAWVEEDFAGEMRHAPPDFETLVRGSFVIYVRQSYTDATGAKTIHVRVSIPPTIAFLRELLRAVAQDEDVRAGTFFRTQNRLEQKDVLMQAIRVAMKSLCAEYVYVPEEPPQASSAAAPETPETPEVLPSDSVSERSARDDNESQSEEGAPSESTARLTDISVSVTSDSK